MVEDLRTDWNAYYDHVPWTARITRRITTNLLLDILKRQGLNYGSKIAEPGGANSCFFDAFTRSLKPAKYTVLDLNQKGLQKFWEKHGENPIAEQRLFDVLAEPSDLRETADLVFSAGLIEHFDTAGTRTAVQHHFDLAKPGGLVLVTFPTPVLTYRLIRTALERAGRWSFPDERPLLFDEVRSAMKPYGTILDERVNRAIGLAQGIIIAQKSL